MVKVGGGLLAIKVIKLNVVYWRSVHVNGKVDTMLKNSLGFGTIGRFFGVSSVQCESLRCPRHRLKNSAWRLRPVVQLHCGALADVAAGGVESATNHNATLASTSDKVVAGLRSGQSMSMEELMEAISVLPGDPSSSESGIPPSASATTEVENKAAWEAAVTAKDEAALLKLLKEAGVD